MIKVLFVCHGNICRSPMAEFVLRDLTEKRGLSEEVSCASAAPSTEVTGNPVHPPGAAAHIDRGSSGLSRL